MKGWDRSDYILFCTLLAALAAIVLSAAASNPSTNSVASWFEAIGVVGALIAAIVMPIKASAEHRSEVADERFMRTGSVAHSLTGAIWLLDIEVAKAERRIAQQDQAPPEAHWQDWARGLKLDIPPVLLNAMPLMHGLQENIIAPFRTAAMLSDTFNGYAERWAKLNYQGIANGWPVLRGQIAGQIALLRHTITLVQAQFPGQE